MRTATFYRFAFAPGKRYNTRHMGKGDRKTKRGKIFQGSNGKTRPKPKTKRKRKKKALKRS